MPTYEYVCDQCSYEFEEFQSITALPLDICPKCSGSVRRKISSGAGLHFKGSGFYITDYKNKNHKKSEQPEKKTEKGPSQTETKKAS